MRLLDHSECRPTPLLLLACPLLLLACLSRPTLAAEGAPSLEERMSYKEFTGLGLDKLTPEQLRGLDAWLQAHEKACAPSAGTAAAPSAQPQPSAPPATPSATVSITSRVAGEFSGWHQGMIIQLKNGQSWEVRDEEPLVVSRMHEPRVTVERGLLDGWTLTVEGHSEIAHVVPVR